MSTYRAGYIEGKTKMSVYVSPEIHKALKLAAVERNESMGDIVERALRKELGMTEKTYRAAYWTDGEGAEVRLTSEEHAGLSDEELLAEARAEAERQGMDLSYGQIVIGEWTE